MTRPPLLFLVLASCAPLAAGAASPDDESGRPAAAVEAPLEVRLDDGRLIKAELDPRTDDQRLWLQLRSSRATLRFSFAWRRVAGLWRAGRAASPGQLQREAAAASPGAEKPSGTARLAIVEGQAAERRAERISASRRSGESVFATREKLATLRIFVRAANWDETPETDGLVLRIQPVLADGAAPPMEGSLQVRLFGRRWRTAGRRPPQGELTRWRRWVRIEDFTEDGALLRLPYRTISPDADGNIAADAVVNVRFSVAGRGVASASAPVRLRRVERLRDSLQMSRGVRFFPEERGR